MAIILDGAKISAQIRAEAAEEAQKLTAQGKRPGLAVILVGHNPASEIYVRNKVKACEQLGIHSEKFTPPDSVQTDELLEAPNQSGIPGVRPLRRHSELSHGE